MRALLMGFCLLATPALAEWTQVRTAQEFQSQVVGHAFAKPSNGSWFRFNANGTLDGGANNQALTGNWQFTRGFACFNRSLGGQALPNDCIVIQVQGDALVTVRDQGRGKQTLYRKQ